MQLVNAKIAFDIPGPRFTGVTVFYPSSISVEKRPSLAYIVYMADCCRKEPGGKYGNVW